VKSVNSVDPVCLLLRESRENPNAGFTAPRQPNTPSILQASPRLRAERRPFPKFGEEPFSYLETAFLCVLPVQILNPRESKIRR
jgi:hypothetical protein